MEGGRGLESAAAPNAPTSATARKKKSLVELWTEIWTEIWIELRIELWMELKNLRMHHPSKGLAYHHRWASPSVGRLRPQSGCPAEISAPAFRQPRRFPGQTGRFHPLSRSAPQCPGNVFNYLRKRTNGRIIAPAQGAPRSPPPCGFARATGTTFIATGLRSSPTPRRWLSAWQFGGAYSGPWNTW